MTFDDGKYRVLYFNRPEEDDVTGNLPEDVVVVSKKIDKKSGRLTVVLRCKDRKPIYSGNSIVELQRFWEGQANQL